MGTGKTHSCRGLPRLFNNWNTKDLHGKEQREEEYITSL